MTSHNYQFIANVHADNKVMSAETTNANGTDTYHTSLYGGTQFRELK